jgi:tight adherence protein C
VTFVCLAGLVFSAGLAMLQWNRSRAQERLWTTEEDDAAEDRWPGSAWGKFWMPPTVEGGQLSALDQELMRAGWYRPTAKRDYLALRNGSMLFVMIYAAAVAVIFGVDHPGIVSRAASYGLLGVGLSWALPRIYLRHVGHQRVKQIQRSLPDALDLLTMCLTGGLALNDAFEHVSREVAFAHSELARELLIVRRQSDLRSTEFAFQQLSRRVGVPEVSALASLITQGQRLGTDVATSIREYADGVRLRRRQAADERSNKAGVKMLFPLTLCLLPSVFIILWGPSVLELFLFLQQFQGASAGR